MSNNKIKVPMKEIKLSLGEVNDKWKKYGLITAPILLKNRKGEFEQSKYKMIIKNNEVAAIVTQRYSTIPNEEAISIIKEATQDTKLKFYQEKSDDYRSYMYYLHPKTYKINNDDSKIQLGIVMKNSINGTLGFSLSLWSFRQVCSNGAVVASSELASITKRHTGTEVIPTVGFVKDAIDSLFDSGRSLIDEYSNMSKVKLNPIIAKQIAVDQRIPRHYMPDYIKVKKGQVDLTANPDCWTVFNDISENIWHNTKTNHGTICQYTELLHRSVMTGIRKSA